MDFIFITGKLGQGKTLAAIDRIKQRIESGCPVATNCDVFLHHMYHRKAKGMKVLRIPDKPTLEDLEAIGRGRPKNMGYDEDRNGLLVLDECGDWFNSRNWQDKTRAGVNSWFRHARKLGWDVYLIVQDIELIDSQARKALAASIARCKRMDKVAIPFVTMFTKAIFGGKGFRLTKFHTARVEDEQGVLLDRWMYSGKHLYAAYDTEQIFMHDYPHATYSLLTPWHLYGRYAKPWTKERIMRLTKIYWKKYSRPAVAVVASLVSTVATAAIMSVATPEINASLMNQAHAEQKATAPETPEKPQTLTEIFQGWTYQGSMVINGRYKYFLANSEGIKMNSTAKALSGYTLQELANCTLEISKGNDYTVLQCPPTQ